METARASYSIAGWGDYCGVASKRRVSIVLVNGNEPFDL
jgi:hypothetical protein